jgi:uncharacterized protein YciI
MMHYLLIYDVVPDYVERRAPLRAEHLALARAAQARGELVLGGALADPVDGAVLLFQGDSPAAAEAFAAADPYVRHGLVNRWRVRKWTTVVGDCAAVNVSVATDEMWCVFRQDDNGNRFVVARHFRREDAERLVAELDARGHKQHYWVEESS